MKGESNMDKTGFQSIHLKSPILYLFFRVGVAERVPS